MKTTLSNHLTRFGSAAALILSAFGFVGTTSAASASYGGTTSGAHHGLSLYFSNQFAGTLTSVEGGDVVASVTTETNQKKHVSNIKQEPIIIQFSPASVSKELFTWLADALAGKVNSADGFISGQGPNGESFRLTFSRAVITEIQFPAMDGASDIPPVITVTFQPLRTSRTFSGVNTASPASAESCNFKVEFPTLDSTHARKVSALVFKRTYSEDFVGELRTPGSRLSPPTFSNLVLTFPATHVASYETWFEDSVLKGNHTDNQEKQGSLRFLDRKFEDIFSLNFTHVGILRLSLQLPQARDLVPDCEIEMYCEGMTLSPGPKLAQTQPSGSSPTNAPQPTTPAGSGNVAGAAPGGTVVGAAATGTRGTLGLPNKFDRLPSVSAASPPNTATSPKKPTATATGPSTGPAPRSSGVREQILLPNPSLPAAPPHSGN